MIPLSLGIEVGGGVVDKILPRNTTIPAAARATYTTQEDNQTGFEIHVVQGERELAADCRSLARFTLKGIPPMPAGMARLEVTFRVDADGLLSVHARGAHDGHRADGRGEADATASTTTTVEQMLLDALDHGEEDLDARRLAEARVEAQRIVLGDAQGARRPTPTCSRPASATRIEAAMRRARGGARRATTRAGSTLRIDDARRRDARTSPGGA